MTVHKQLPFTVLCFDEDNGQINLFHVEAASGMAAFTTVASQDPERDLTFMAALPGHQNEGQTITLPGEGLVSASTVLGQPDVFC